MLIEKLETRQLFADFAIVQSDIPPFVAGHVFLDSDRSGDQTDRWYGYMADRGMYAARVYLDLNNNGQRDKLEPTTLTNEDGWYFMTGFSEHTMKAKKVRCVVPADSIATTSTARQGGGDFGIAPARAEHASSIGTDVVLNVPESKLQPGQTRSNATVSRVRVYIDLDRDGKRDKKEPSALTHGWGRVQFTDLIAGTYLLRMSTPAGFTAESAAMEVRVREREKRTKVFRLIAEREVKFNLYHDANGNGRRDENESWYIDGRTRVDLTLAAPLSLHVQADEKMGPHVRGAALPRVAATLWYDDDEGEMHQLTVSPDATEIDLPV